MNWKFVGVVSEGMELKINGINVWSQQWTLMKGDTAEVTNQVTIKRSCSIFIQLRTVKLK